MNKSWRIVCGKRAHPRVMFVVVLGRRRHELNHRAQGTLRAQDGPAAALRPAACTCRCRKIAPENLCHLLHVAVIIPHEHRALQESRSRWTSKFPTCRRRKRCKVCDTACRAAARPPVARPSRPLLLHPHTETRRQHVRGILAQRQPLAAHRSSARQCSRRSTSNTESSGT